MKVIGAFIPDDTVRRIWTPRCNGKEIRAAVAERNRQGLMNYQLKRSWYDSGAMSRPLAAHTPSERLGFEVCLHRKLERCRSFLDRLRYTRGPQDFMKGLK